MIYFDYQSIMEVTSHIDYEKINQYLTHIFNNVLVIEESSLRTSQFSDVSIKEMHTLSAIGEVQVSTPSEIAKSLMITTGTVTISLNRLEKKGYLTRNRSPIDKRVVEVRLTRKGRLIYRLHRKFHMEMVKKITASMDERDANVLLSGLENLHLFLEAIK